MKIYTTRAALAFCALAIPLAARAATPPDPCATISKADASKALGAPIVKVLSQSMGPSRSCTFRANKAFSSVVLTTFRWGSPREARDAFHDMISVTSKMMSPSLTLHGIGDEAQRIGPNIYVRKGTAAYVFNVINGSVGNAKAASSESLARKTMAHIKA